MAENKKPQAAEDKFKSPFEGLSDEQKAKIYQELRQAELKSQPLYRHPAVVFVAGTITILALYEGGKWLIRRIRNPQAAMDAEVIDLQQAA